MEQTKITMKTTLRNGGSIKLWRTKKHITLVKSQENKQERIKKKNQLTPPEQVPR